MSSRRAIAAGLWVVLVAMVMAQIGLRTQGEDLIASVVVGTWLVGVGSVGALIAGSKSRNPIGWLLIAIAMLIAAGLLTEAYASYALEFRAQSFPLARAAAWATLWLTVPGFALFIFVFLLFPTGRLPTPRWRPVAWAASSAAALQVLYLMVKPGPIDNIPVLDNPLALPRLADVLFPLTNFAQTIMVAAALAAVASLVVRFRRAGGVERQQIKIVAAGSVVLPLCFGLVMLLDALFGLPEGAEEGPEWAGFIINMIGLFAIPVSIGIAILRYRLYDIDVIINRALVYGTLTAILAAAYVGLVVAFQGLLRPLTEQSDLAVAASTLAVAALFGPVRRRVQRFIDRRFYRSRYDAQQTLENFSARLRDEIDLEHLTSELVGVVAATVRPRHASLWLREASR